MFRDQTDAGLALSQAAAHTREYAGPVVASARPKSVKPVSVSP
jgi:hypothetical protein